MDSSDTEYDMIDLLAWNCNQLTAQLADVKSEAEQSRILADYIKRVDEEFKEINDFREDLDWFNVTEPLSLKDQLHGKVLILDFFTYCCINCMHILPDLKRLEQLYSVEEGLVVVGVHSAKFDNEKDSSNILSAVQRYEIVHPVVNDLLSSMWMDLQIKCWPTLLVLGPRGNPLFVFMGEGHYKTLEKYMTATMKFYGSTNALRSNSLPLNPAIDLIISSKLKFPGKIACSKEGDEGAEELYAISDSGNHRILLVERNGTVVEKIGGKTSGFADGDFVTARFNSPQGVTFFNKHTIYVADTDNHAVRLINLREKKVETIAGHGKQGVDQVGGLIGIAQEISSPWDVATYRTRDMDMSFHIDEESIPEKDLILIAMAGTHQIWAAFVDETIWWKFKKFPEGSVAAIAGNGHEENRNNSYPQNAAFAQPSGLAISAKHKELYIADSESSCVRKLNLADGKVLAVVGGDRNPLNLFAFGDVDGTHLTAKLQHPLGVAYSAKHHCLYVADTYNHKIKKIDLATNTATTCVIKNAEGSNAQFNEPGGLCLSPGCDKLYITDTNNHTIEVVSLENLVTETLKLQFNSYTQNGFELGDKVKLATALKIQPTGAKLRLVVHLKAGAGAKFTQGAPQKWNIALPNKLWKSPLPGGSIENNANDETDAGSHQTCVEVTAPSIRNSQEMETVTISFKLNLCATNKNICYPKLFSVDVPVIYNLDGMATLEENIFVSVSEGDVKIV